MTTALTSLPPIRLQGFDLAHFEQMKQTKTVPHAFLFSGVSGLGKAHIACHCAAILLCERTPAPCGQCQGCRWQQAATHPDYYAVHPEDDATAIKIAQVRAMIPFLQQTPQQAGFRVVVMEPVDSLTIEAANSLLKTLEEPGANTVLFLVTAQPMLLPATIRSRCVHITCQIPPMAESCAWLQQALHQAGIDATVTECQQWLVASDGAPLAALALASDPECVAQRQAWLVALSAVFQGAESPVAVAQTWSNRAVDELLKQWITACCSLLGQGHDYRLSIPESWTALVIPNCDDIGNIKKLFDFVRILVDARRVLHSRTQPNVQLLLENLLVKWYGLASE